NLRSTFSSSSSPSPGFCGTSIMPSLGSGNGSVNRSRSGLGAKKYSYVIKFGTLAATCNEARCETPAENPVWGAYRRLCAWTSAPTRRAPVKPPTRATSGCTTSMAPRRISSRNPNTPNSLSPASLTGGLGRHLVDPGEVHRRCIAGDAGAARAAQHFVHRQTGRLAQDVPERGIDAAQRFKHEPPIMPPSTQLLEHLVPETLDI